MNKLAITLVLTLVAATVARAQDKQADPPAAGGMQMMQMMQDCPMRVQGVEVAASDIPDGIAVEFTTKSGSVDELRRRVERMAAMHFGTGAEATSAKPMMMPAGIAKYEAIPNGARLTLTPKDPAQLAAFRTQIRTHVERMAIDKEKGCSMMQEMMQEMMKGMMVGGMGKDIAAPPKAEPGKEEPGAGHEGHRPEAKP